jgi:hypothetical protein
VLILATWKNEDSLLSFPPIFGIFRLVDLEILPIKKTLAFLEI